MSETFRLRAVMVGVAGVLLLALMLICFNVYAPMRLGYCEQALAGRAETIWVKCGGQK